MLLNIKDEGLNLEEIQAELEIESAMFEDVKYSVKEGCLVIDTGKSGVIEMSLDSAKAFSGEIIKIIAGYIEHINKLQNTRTCPVCNTEFVSERGKKYCSENCAGIMKKWQYKEWKAKQQGISTPGSKEDGRTSLHSRVCKICGEGFMAKGNRAVYCSTECKKRGNRINQHNGNAEKQRTIKNMNLAETDRIAKSKGLTYGKESSQRLLKAQRERMMRSKEGKI